VIHHHARARMRGATLVMSLALLALVTLLGLAGANAAHIELALAQNGQFHENAVAAASAGIESAIGRIITATTPESVPTSLSSVHERFEVVTRFLGYDRALPQVPGARLAGARFEIVATGHAARNAIDRQRAQVLLAVDAPADRIAADCAPSSPLPCHARGQLVRLSWQRVRIE
jgi:hypothetical protein